MSVKKGNIKKLSGRSILKIAILFTVIIVLMFMTIYLLLEYVGYHSTFNFRTSIWMRSTEGYILFMIALTFTVLIGSIIVLYMLKKYS